MIVSSSIVLCMVIIQGAYGTIFPPVSEDPPRPGQSVRSFSPALEDLSREEEYFRDNTQRNEERWYNGEIQSKERREDEFSSDAFEKYYERGEPAVGPVATPKPDIYAASSSEITGFQPANIWMDYEDATLARSTEGRYSSSRWVEVQPLDGRVIEDVNLNSGVSTDTVKSIAAAPIPFKTPPNTQLPQSAVNIVQVRLPNVVRLQTAYANSPTVFRSVPAVKQNIGALPIALPNVKTIVQQQEVVRDIQPVALAPPSSAQILPKKGFVVPPPPPPPLKGVNSPPKVISASPVNIVPNINAAVSNKNIIPDSSIVSGKSSLQQVRHVWIPTSSKTGKFISIPISGSIKSEKIGVNKGFSLESTPVTVSDTWILKQDGPVPVFQQEKSPLPSVPSPVVQSGKVIFQNPTILQVDEPANPIVTRIDSPKTAPVFEKTVISDASRDIWPARKEITSKIGYSSESAINVPPSAVKSDALVIRKSIPEPLQSPQKSVIVDTKSAIQPQIASSTVQILNGKPCPFPLPAPQKSLVAPVNGGLIPLSRIVANQRKLPFARIIRINRYPIGSYYMLNRNIRPSYFIYPNQAVIQQPKTELISLIQTKQIPTYFERKIPLPPVQTKQITIPVQSKHIASPLPAKQIAYPFVSRQVILPVVAPKSSRTIFPAMQNVKYAYPWNAYLKSSPIIDFNPFKTGKSGSESDSSSSESSSSEESSKEKKEEKSKKEKKPKKEEKPKSTENSNSGESEKESEAETSSKSLEKESEEKNSEKESEESLETSESQISLNFQTSNNAQGFEMGENTRVNIVSNLGGIVDGETTSSDSK